MPGAIDSAAHIGIRVVGDTSDATLRVQHVTDQLRGLNSQANSTATGLLKFSGVMATVAAGIRTAQGIIDASDAWTNLNNKIKVVNDGLEKQLAVQERVYNISKLTSVGLDDVSKAYGRMATSTKNLGVSQKDVLDVTEGLLKAFKSYGTTGTESAATIQQLGQALGAARLNGDELKSILEASPAVADAIAKKFGIARGELKKWGEEGKLDAKNVFLGIQEGLAKFDEDFQKRIPSITDGFTRLESSATRITGVIMEWLNAPSVVGSALDSLGGLFDSAADSIQSGSFGVLFKLITKQLSDSLLGDAVDILKEFSSSAGEYGKIAGKFFSDNWSTFIPTLEAGIKGVFLNIGTFINDSANTFSTMWKTIVGTSEEAKKAMDDYNASLDKSNAALNAGMRQIQEQLIASETEAKTAIAASEAKIAQFKKEREERKKLLEERGVEQKVSSSVKGSSSKEDVVDAAEEGKKAAEQLDLVIQNKVNKDLNSIMVRRAANDEFDKYTLESLRGRYNTELQMKLDHDRVMDDIEAAHRQGALDSESEYLKMKFLAQQEYFTSVLDQTMNFGNSLNELTATHLGANAGIYVSTFGQVAGILSAHSEKAFKITKGFALVDATISTLQGIAKGVSLGWPMAVPAVAYAAATGYAQIQKIRSMSYSGGSGGGGSVGGAAVAASAPTGGGGGGGADLVRVLRVEGLDPNALFSGSQAKGLLKTIDDFRADGGGTTKVVYA